MKKKTNKSSAVTEYFLAVSQVKDEIKELERLIGKHGDGEEIRWGHFGDMATVRERLREVNAFLRNDG
jgi:hypothetical protein